MIEKMLLKKQDCSCHTKFFAHRAGVRKATAKRVKRAYKSAFNSYLGEITRAANAGDFETIEGLATPHVESGWELT